MGVLAPLYLAGLAALSLPLIFHLVRRTPRGRQEFSSLMFLLPSPPRLTRRSRLDQILLLLLRLAATTWLLSPIPPAQPAIPRGWFIHTVIPSLTSRWSATGTIIGPGMWWPVRRNWAGCCR